MGSRISLALRLFFLLIGSFSVVHFPVDIALWSLRTVYLNVRHASRWTQIHDLSQKSRFQGHKPSRKPA